MGQTRCCFQCRIDHICQTLRHVRATSLSNIFADSCCINEQGARHIDKPFYFSLRRPIMTFVFDLTTKPSFDVKLNICLYNLLFNLMKNEVGMSPRMIKSLLEHQFWTTSDEELHWKIFTVL